MSEQPIVKLGAYTVTFPLDGWTCHCDVESVKCGASVAHVDARNDPGGATVVYTCTNGHKTTITAKQLEAAP